MKKVLIISFLILLTLTLLSGCSIPTAAYNIVGTWEGNVTISGGNISLIMKTILEVTSQNSGKVTFFLGELQLDPISLSVAKIDNQNYEMWNNTEADLLIKAKFIDVNTLKVELYQYSTKEKKGEGQLLRKQ